MGKIYLVKKRVMHETWCLVVEDNPDTAGARALENDGVRSTEQRRNRSKTTMTIYNVNGIKFTSLRKAIDYAKCVCFDEKRKCSVWVDGERTARATFCYTSEGRGGVYRAEPDYDVRR